MRAHDGTRGALVTASRFQSGLVLAFAVALVGVSARASAASDSAAMATPLMVERDAAAASCPNAADLVALVESVRGGAAPASVRYGVHFSRVGEAFHARIEDLERHQVRDLDDEGDNCSGITRATVVTLALLFDAELASAVDVSPATETHSNESLATDPIAAGDPADANRTPSGASSMQGVRTSDSIATAKPQTGAATPTAPRSAVVVSPDVSPNAGASPVDGADESTRVRLGVMIGGGAVVGVAAPYALGPSAALDLEGRWLRGEVSAFWSPPQPRDFGGGTVRTELFTGALAGCFSPARPFALRLDVCAGITAGQLTARARGFASDGQSRRPWLAVPAFVSLASEAGLSWQINVGLLVPVQREDFRIAGFGQTYESWAVAGFVGLRLGLRTL